MTAACSYLLLLDEYESQRISRLELLAYRNRIPSDSTTPPPPAYAEHQMIFKPNHPSSPIPDKSTLGNPNYGHDMRRG